MARLRDWMITEDGRAGPILRQCIAAAAAAPSVHNTQPWQFRARPDGVEVRCDRSRQLPVIDPTGREMLLSVGAALLNLRVAVLAHGRSPVVRLMPDPESEDLIADVAFGPPTTPSVSVRLLHRCIEYRRTNRRAFAPTTPPARVLNEIAEAARVEGGRLSFAGAGVTALLCLIRLAARRQEADPAYRAEIAEWTRTNRARNDGVPPEAFAPPGAGPAVPLRDFALGADVRRRKAERFEIMPTLALLYSPARHRQDVVAAGQAMQRALLTATARGVATTLITAPTEVPHVAEMLRDGSTNESAQAIIRFGYGQPSASVPRRPVEEILQVAASPALAASA